MDILGKLTKQDIENAVHKYKELGGREPFFEWCRNRVEPAQHFRKPRSYWLLHSQIKYACRPIVVAAYCIQTGCKKKIPGPVKDDSGIRKKLCGLGFKLVSTKTGEPVCYGARNVQTHQPAQAKKAPVRSAATLGPTRESRGSSFGAGGESEAHKKLRKFIASHPEILDLPARAGKGKMEVALPSGDKLDVHFVSGRDRIAVEVKSALSSIPDITRGMFQCVKYRAVMEAEQASRGEPRSARAILVLENQLPTKLKSLKKLLGIKLRDLVIPT